MVEQLVYHMCRVEEWAAAQRRGTYAGSSQDVADGFIHFSTAAQARETAARHFAGQSDLLLIAIDGAKLGDALKYEVSRGGALFPHLYAEFDLDAVLWVKPLPLGANGHEFPALEGE